MIAKPTLKIFITDEPVHGTYVWERLELTNGMTSVCLVLGTDQYPGRHHPGVGWWHTNDGNTPLEHLEYPGYPMDRLIVFAPDHPFLDSIGQEYLPDEAASFVDTLSNTILGYDPDDMINGLEQCVCPFFLRISGTYIGGSPIPW